VKLVLAITRGIIRDQSTRRWTMFVLIFLAVVNLFSGATFLSGWLGERPIMFLLYWVGCAWLTLAAVLLAFFDMFIVRASAREWKKGLRRAFFGEEDDG
jgi:hypothetical protein